jgi:steroid delta-isomerase-like uncharacterized protein
MATPSPASLPSPHSLINAAKAPILAYGDKNWHAVRNAIAPDAVYDEIATGRRAQGADEVLACWKAWATATTDSKATIHNAVASGNTVVIELTWRGTHNGPLQLGDREIAATNRAIDLRACQVCDMVAGKPQVIRQYFDLATLLRQIGA